MKRIRLLFFGIMLAFLMSIPTIANASEVYKADVDYDGENTPVVD